MTAAYYTVVALFALSCLASWLTWAVLKLVALREGFTDALEVLWEYLI